MPKCIQKPFFSKTDTHCCDVSIEWAGPATHMEESLHSSRSPFSTCLSGRAQSGRWSSFGTPVCFTESHLILVISFNLLFYSLILLLICGAGSSVGIANELRAGRTGIESRCGRDFPAVQTGPGAHPATCKMGTGSFPGVKCDRGVLLVTLPLLVPRSWKSRAIPLPTLWATPACNGITLPLPLYIPRICVLYVSCA